MICKVYPTIGFRLRVRAVAPQPDTIYNISDLFFVLLVRTTIIPMLEIRTIDESQLQ